MVVEAVRQPFGDSMGRKQATPKRKNNNASPRIKSMPVGKQKVKAVDLVCASEATDRAGGLPRFFFNQPTPFDGTHTLHLMWASRLLERRQLSTSLIPPLSFGSQALGNRLSSLRQTVWRILASFLRSTYSCRAPSSSLSTKRIAKGKRSMDSRTQDQRWSRLQTVLCTRLWTAPNSSL